MGKYPTCPLILIVLIQLSNGAVQIHELDENTELHKCVTMIIQRIELVNLTDVTLINVNVSLSKELHSLLDHPIRFISRSFYWPKDTLYNDVYIIQFADYLMFSHGMDLVRRDPFWNPRAKFVIIIEYIDDFLQNISEFLTYNHIDDVALVAYGEDQEVLVYTFGLEHDECDRPVFSEMQLLSRCSEIHNFERIYVAARKTSLRGCHVKFVSHNYWPFISFEKKDAVENYLLTLIRQYENITVDVVNFGKIEHFGYRLKNFTYTGMLHEIEIYHVEGAIGGFMLNFNPTSNLDFVYPYMVDHYRIVIARSDLLSKWMGVLKQIGAVNVWMVFGTFCILCVIVTLMDIFKRGQRDTCRDILIVWGYFLGNINQKQYSKSRVAYRIVLLNILMYVFIISITTQASVLSVSMRPIRDVQPTTVKEVLSNYQLLLSPNQYAYLQSNSVVNLKNVNLICKSTLNCMTQVMTKTDDRLFTIASDLYHQFYVWEFADKNGEPKIHKIRESFATLLQTMYIRRGSSLADPFNRMLLRIRSSGLIDKFLERVNFRERLKYKFQTRKKGHLSLYEIKSVFMLLVYGYGLSAISFMLEYLSYKTCFLIGVRYRV